MDWINISKIKKFTPVNEVFNNYGRPLFKLDSRPVYYMGNGFLLSFTHKMFKVENNCRG